MSYRPLRNLMTVVLAFSSLQCQPKGKGPAHGNIQKVHFHLSAYGVESTGFPTIDAEIDLSTKSSRCDVTYYEPHLQPRSYTLSPEAIDTVARLIESMDLEHFKKRFTMDRSDQPTSTLTIKTKTGDIEIIDYGLEGDAPLLELYRIVYRLQENFR